MAGALDSINNAGSRIGSTFNSATAGTDGGYESNSAENAERLTDATGAADSKVTNAGIEKIQTDAKSAVEALSQDSDTKHISSVITAAKGITY